jgi:hypothetical protein
MSPPAHAGVTKGLPSLLLTGLCEFICIVKTSLAVYGGQDASDGVQATLPLSPATLEELKNDPVADEI